MASSNSPPVAVSLTSETTRLKYDLRKRRKDEISHGSESDGFLAFSLVIANLLVLCSYLMVVANMAHLKMTWLGVFILIVHAVASELFMAGTRKKKIWFHLPWVLIVIVDELVLVSLALSHLGTSMTEKYNDEFGTMFREKGAFIIVNAVITGEMIVLILLSNNQYF